jgi:hypothetical protein
MTAYAGRFTFTGNKVIHHVEAASMPNDVGSTLEREIAKPYLRGGMMVHSQELTWERTT